MATYSDIDLSFKKHPGTGDVFRLLDEDAVKAAMSNILQTLPFEKPFDPNFGMGLHGLLFENLNPAFKIILRKKILEQFSLYEPRVVVEDVTIDQADDNNSIGIYLYYYIVGYTETQSLNIVIERMR